MADEGSVDTGAEGIDAGASDGIDTGADGTQAAPQRADYLLDGYNDAEAQARAFKDNYAWALEVEQRYQNDPQFREWYDRGHQPQQQQQQQQQAQPNDAFAFLEAAKDPAVAAAYQMALANGGQLPENYPNSQAMMQKFQGHQAFWDKMYLSPDQGFGQLLDHPAIQQKILQISGQAVQPIQQQFQQQQHQQLVQNYGPKLSQMHPTIQQQFKQGRFGTGEEAAKAALEIDALIKAGGQAPQGGQSNNNKQQAGGPQPPKQQQKPKPPGDPRVQQDVSLNGSTDSREAKMKQQSRELAKQAAKAKMAEMKDR